MNDLHFERECLARKLEAGMACLRVEMIRVEGELGEEVPPPEMPDGLESTVATAVAYLRRGPMALETMPIGSRAPARKQLRTRES